MTEERQQGVTCFLGVGEAVVRVFGEEGLVPIIKARRKAIKESSV